MTAEDLDSLVSDGAAEGHELEFKRELPSQKIDARKEFLADVSAFANTRGGYLFYGIEESQGVATGIPGLPAINPDNEIARLQSMIESGIEPRLHGHTIRAIPSTNGAPVIALHIPVSWARPHVARIEGHWRFYVRDSSGKHPLDVGELRDLVTATDAVAVRARAFRAERLSRILGGEAPTPIGEGPKVVLHFIPVQAFAPGAGVDLAPAVLKRPAPLYTASWSHRRNFDGFLTWSDGPDREHESTYLQVFRNGCLEAVEGYLLAPHGPPPDSLIPSTALEDELIEGCTRYLELERTLGVGPPVLVMLTLLGVRGYRMAISGGMVRADQHAIEHNDLLMPEILVEDLASEVAPLLRSTFDLLWNACGLSRSFNYDESGSRIRRS